MYVYVFVYIVHFAFEKKNLLGLKRKVNNHNFAFCNTNAFKLVSSLQQIILYLETFSHG